MIINTETRSVEVNKKGVYFAFRDQGACLSLLAIKVLFFYVDNCVSFCCGKLYISLILCVVILFMEIVCPRNIIILLCEYSVHQEDTCAGVLQDLPRNHPELCDLPGNPDWENRGQH